MARRFGVQGDTAWANWPRPLEASERRSRLRVKAFSAEVIGNVLGKIDLGPQRSRKIGHLCSPQVSWWLARARARAHSWPTWFEKASDPLFHFIRRTEPGWDDPVRMLHSLTAQVCRKHGIDASPRLLEECRSAATLIDRAKASAALFAEVLERLGKRPSVYPGLPPAEKGVRFPRDPMPRRALARPAARP